MSLTRHLVEGLATLDYTTFGERDRAALRDKLLDHLACAARGSRTASAAAARAFVGEMEVHGKDAVPLIGTRESAPPPIGALLNAVAAHSIEYDDLHNSSSTHPGVVIFPSALAAASMAGADGEAFLLGAAIGYEVMGRVGRAAGPAGQYRRYLHPTSTCGALGAAATTASILGLDVETTVSALGIAATMAGGSMQFLEDGAWTKRLHPGLAARGGIQAALLAKAGFYGGEDGIGGSKGFLVSVSDEARPERLLEGFGDGDLEVTETSLKAHTCCRYKQGPIDALLALRAAHRLTPEEVAEVELGLVSAGVDIIAEPVEAKRAPRNVVEAQFSMPYGAAVALCDGRADLAQYDETRLSDPRVKALMARVHYRTDPALDARYPAHWPAWARITTRDGRVLEAQVDDPKGDPGNPLSPAELRAKCDALMGQAYSDERREAIVHVTERLDEPGAFKTWIDLLSADAA